MLTTYANCVNTYRAINSNFFDFIMNQSVSTIHEHPKILPVIHILLHLVNATPSVTLAQFYFYVFKGEFCFGEMCEFFFNTCNMLADDLFIQRTQYILYRYQTLGDGRAITILDKLCSIEMFLFPLLLQCKSDNEKLLDRMFVETSNELLLQDGSCRATDALYDSLYRQLDIMQAVFDYTI